MSDRSYPLNTNKIYRLI